MAPETTTTDELSLLSARVAEFEAEKEAWHERAGSSFEADIRELAEQMRAVLWISSVNNQVKFYVGRAYERIWGRSRDELAVNPSDWLDAIHPDDRARVEDARPSQVTGKYDVEFRVLHPDGSIRWVRDRAFPLTNARGEVDRIAGIAEDITERKRAQEVLETVVAGVSAKTGEAFLESLITHIADVLACDWVMICLPTGEGLMLRTVACCQEGRIVDELVYDSRQAPCEHALGGAFVFCSGDVQSRYPEDTDLVEMGIESYIGAPLKSPSGEVMAILVALKRGPLDDPGLARSLFNLFSDRAAAELARTRAEEALRRTNEHLEARVAERTADLETTNALLKTSEERYRVFIEQSSDGFWCIEGDGPIRVGRLGDDAARAVLDSLRIVECNDVLASRIGQASARDVLGLPISDVPTVWQGEAERHLLELLRGKRRTAEFETLVTDENGRHRVFQNKIVGILEGLELVRVWGTQIELTDLREEEQARRNIEIQNEAIIQSALDGIAILDMQGNFLEVNAAYTDATGYSRVELLQMNVADLNAEDQVGDIRHHLELTRRDGSWRSESTTRRKDGSLFEVEISARYRDLDGGRVFCFVRDVSVRMRAEARERQHLAELAHVDRLRTAGELASSFAHELNQPLAAIVSYTKGCERRMRARGDADSEELHALEQAAAQAERAGATIRSIRNFVSKRDQQKLPCSMNQVIQEAIQLVRNEAKQKGVVIQLELTESDDGVLGDVIQIEQVVLNLARNSFEAMAETDAADRVVTIRSRGSGSGMVEVAVCDTGPGVPPDQAQEVFEPFFTTKSDGMGMGLSISSSIIEAHGGRLWLSPRPGRGACFQFSIPAYSAERPHAH